MPRVIWFATLGALLGSIVGLGVGVEFSRQASLLPVVSIPFGVRGAHTSYGITIAVNLSGAH